MLYSIITGRRHQADINTTCYLHLTDINNAAVLLSSEPWGRADIVSRARRAMIGFEYEDREPGDATWELLRGFLEKSEARKCVGAGSSPLQMHFSALQTIILCAITVTCDDLVRFLSRHNSTLEQVHLDAVQIIQGTWVNPLSMIVHMPKIKRLTLRWITDSSIPLEEEDYDKLYAHEDVYSLELNNRNDIHLAANALKVARTIGMEYHGKRGSQYKVDLRRAKAVMEGKIEYRDGRWNLLSKGPRPVCPDGLTLNGSRCFDLYIARGTFEPSMWEEAPLDKESASDGDILSDLRSERAMLKGSEPIG
jgi:hypothetical protein